MLMPLKLEHQLKPAPVPNRKVQTIIYSLSSYGVVFVFVSVYEHGLVPWCNQSGAWMRKMFSCEVYIVMIIDFLL
jgi:hypothetical protein